MRETWIGGNRVEIRLEVSSSTALASENSNAAQEEIVLFTIVKFSSSISEVDGFGALRGIRRRRPYH